MRFLRLLLMLLFCSAPATAADLSKLDRTIAKEPKYQAKPKYCLLVFGPHAKTKVWLALDGDVLYVDRDGNGDLTGDEKKVRRGNARGQAAGNFVCGDIVQADGKTICSKLTVSGSAEEGDMWVTINVDGKHNQSAGVDANGFLEFADSPGRAPIIHFDGPRTMAPVPVQEITRTATLVKKGDKAEVVMESKARATLPTFVQGANNSELRVAVGTVGQGKGTFARIHHHGLAYGIQPVVELEFPNRDPAKATIKIKLARLRRIAEDGARRWGKTDTTVRNGRLCQFEPDPPPSPHSAHPVKTLPQGPKAFPLRKLAGTLLYGKFPSKHCSAAGGGG